MLQHMAELTVRETLDFSRRVQGAGSRGGKILSPCKYLACFQINGI